MNNTHIKILIGIIISCSANALFGIVPTSILLKNGSSFDIVYKPLFAQSEVYQYGKSTPLTYEENLISAGSGKVVSVGSHRPLRFSIKRYGYGSDLSSWFDVPAPEDLAREQLTADQQQEYQNAIDGGKLAIITVTSGYLGGWNFSIGYMR